MIVTTDWDELSAAQLRAAMEGTDTLEAAMEGLKHAETCPVCGHSHHEHHHEHHHDEDCECHEHKHEHHHDEHCECHEHKHEHHHEHHHGEHCTCGCHDHDHHGHDHHGHDHHHHHADEVFQSFGAETAKHFCPHCLGEALAALADEEKYGHVLRAKGIVAGEEGWLHFDYVPGEPDVRPGSAAVIGRLCVIGAGLDRAALSTLFGVELK